MINGFMLPLHNSTGSYWFLFFLYGFLNKLDVYSTYPGPDVNERKPALPGAGGGGRAQVKDMIKDNLRASKNFSYSRSCSAS